MVVISYRLKGGMIMSDKIKDAYKSSKDIYDDVLAKDKWWSKLYIDLLLGGADDNEIASELLRYIPDDFSGKLLDVPAGTAVFTHEKYSLLKNADITCIDYSSDMLSHAKERFEADGVSNVTLLEGNVESLPYEDSTFDIVLSMNGMHVFKNKNRAILEILRVLKKGGKLISCFYIEGQSKRTDFLVNKFLAKKGWFTPPYFNRLSVQTTFSEIYDIQDFHIKGSMVYFCAVKK